MKVVSALTGSAVVVAAVVSIASPAAAQPQDMACELSIGSASPLPPWAPNMVVTVEPAAASSGNSVNVTLDVGEYTNGPVPIPAGQIVPNAVVELSGGQTGEVPLVGQANTAAILAGGPFVVGPMTGTFEVDASGDIALSVTRVFFDNPQVDIICTPTADAVVQATVAVAGAAPSDSPAESPSVEEPEPTDEATEATSESDDGGGSALPWILLGLAAVAGVAAAGWYFGSRRRPTPESPAGSETDGNAQP